MDSSTDLDCIRDNSGQYSLRNADKTTAERIRRNHLPKLPRAYAAAAASDPEPTIGVLLKERDAFCAENEALTDLVARLRRSNERLRLRIAELQGPLYLPQKVEVSNEEEEYLTRKARRGSMLVSFDSARIIDKTGEGERPPTPTLSKRSTMLVSFESAKELRSLGIGKDASVAQLLSCEEPQLIEGEEMHRAHTSKTATVIGILQNHQLLPDNFDQTARGAKQNGSISQDPGGTSGILRNDELRKDGAAVQNYHDQDENGESLLVCFESSISTIDNTHEGLGCPVEHQKQILRSFPLRFSWPFTGSDKIPVDWVRRSNNDIENLKEHDTQQPLRRWFWPRPATVGPGGESQNLGVEEKGTTTSLTDISGLDQYIQSSITSQELVLSSGQKEKIV